MRHVTPCSEVMAFLIEVRGIIPRIAFTKHEIKYLKKTLSKITRLYMDINNGIEHRTVNIKGR